jgi:hypothetical protein
LAQGKSQLAVCVVAVSADVKGGRMYGSWRAFRLRPHARPARAGVSCGHYGRYRRPRSARVPRCALALAVIVAISTTWTASLAGQATRGSAEKELGSLMHSPLPHVPDDRVKGPEVSASPATANDESCFLWQLTGVGSPTAGVASLRVPEQARKDFRARLQRGQRQEAGQDGRTST